VLTLESVTKRFGGLTAVRAVSLEVRRGDLLGIIGPNGAGKTTLFNVIAGYYRPEEGRIVFEGRDVTGLPAHAISRLGLTRTFQIVKPFGNLSVADNVMIGALTRLQRVRDARVEAERVIALCGLGPHAPARARAVWAPSSRFSVTVMNGKSRRPSGTCTMPRSTRRAAGTRARSSPSKSTRPCRGPTRPEITRSVVLLPAALAPTSAKMPPAGTSSETLNSACRSP